MRQPQHNTNPQQFFLGARQAAGLSRGIFPGAGKRTVSNQTNHRAQKGYTAHIPRALRIVHRADKSGDHISTARQ